MSEGCNNMPDHTFRSILVEQCERECMRDHTNDETLVKLRQAVDDAQTPVCLMF